MMNWRDDRLGVQIEHALSKVRLTPGCDLDVLIHRGEVELFGQLIWTQDLETILETLLSLPGVKEIRVNVAVAEPLLRDKHLGQGGRGRRWDLPFGNG